MWTAGRIRYEGRSSIRAAFTKRQESSRTSRHVCTDLQVDVVDADRATGPVYLTLYRFDGPGPGAPEAELVGDYNDVFVRTPDGWRFAERHTTVAFTRA